MGVGPLLRLPGGVFSLSSELLRGAISGCLLSSAILLPTEVCPGVSWKVNKRPSESAGNFSTARAMWTTEWAVYKGVFYHVLSSPVRSRAGIMKIMGLVKSTK